MVIDDFRRRFEFIHKMTADFAANVPDQYWSFSPVPAVPTGGTSRTPGALGHGEGFAPFCKQLRHVVCVRGVYTAALTSGAADFARKHSHYDGPLTRPDLLAALHEKRSDLLAALETVDVSAAIDFFGRPFSFGDFAYTLVQHEAIHHGQWSVYALLAGFATPPLWRSEWGL